MKIPAPKLISIAACICVLLANQAGAAVAAWDPTGTTNTTGCFNGIWDTTTKNWTVAGTQTTVPAASLVAWTSGSLALFCAGPSASASQGSCTVVVNAAVTIGGIDNGKDNPGACNVTINNGGSGSLVLPSATVPINSQGTACGSTTINAPITGVGPLQLFGCGTTTLAGTNTYTGQTIILGANNVTITSVNRVSGPSVGSSLGRPTTVANGTIAIGSSATPGVLIYTGPGETTDRVINLAGTSGGATIQSDGSGPIAFTNVHTATVAGAKNLTLQGSNTGTNTMGKIVDSSSGATSLTKAGSGVWKLSGANTYSGTTTVSGGTLQLGIATGIPSGNGKGVLNIVSPGAFDLNGFSASPDGVTGNGAVTNSTGSGTLTVGSGGTNSAFTGLIQNATGTLSLAKTGAGTFTISGANTYSGLTTISAGTLQVDGDNTIPATSSVIIANGATLDMNNSHSDTITALSGAGNVINDNTSLTVNGNANVASSQNFNGYSCLSGSVGGGGSLVKDGTHAMALRGDNSPFLGAFILNAGTLSVGAAPDRIWAGLLLTIPTGAIFQLDASSQTLGSINGGGSVNLGGGTFTLNQAGNDNFNGIIQNSELSGSSTALGHGLRGYYYTNIDFTGLGVVRDDATVNLADMTALPGYSLTAKTNQLSIRWLGRVLTTAAGQYVFSTKCDDGQRLWVNGALLVDDWAAHGATLKSGTNTLAGNTAYDIVMEYFQNTAGGAAQLFWTPPGDSSVIIPSSNLLLPGPGTFVKTGPGTQALSATNTYTGRTTVSQGILEAQNDGALGRGSVSVADGATLIMENGLTNGYINPSADLLLSGSAPVVNLFFTGTNTIHALSYDGGTTYQPSGIYGPIGSGATFENSRFTGTGLGFLNVVAIPSANALTATPGTAVYGAPVNLTSTITGSGATPTGTVTFYDNGYFLGLATLNGSGVASLSVSNLLVAASPHPLTAIYSGDATYATSTSAAALVSTTPASVTSVPVVATRGYDGTSNATIASIAFSGILDSDTNYVHLSGAYTAFFADPYVGVNKNVSLTNLALSGSLSANYVLSTNALSSTGSITNKALTFSGITATNRVYDANTDAGYAGSLVLNGVIAADVGLVTNNPPVLAFTTKNSGLAKPVTVSATLTAGLGTNYLLVLTNLSANITNFSLGVGGITANNKIYDGGTNATLSGTATNLPAAFSGDVVILGGSPVASFATAAVGNGKAVTVTNYAIFGADAANYTLSQPAGLTANITQAATAAALVSSANPSTLTSNVNFKLTVTATTPTTNPPTGMVTFYTNGSPVSPSVALASNTPASATASFNTALLPVGTNPVTVVYGGDASFLAPLSPTVQQVVQSTVCSQTNAILSITSNGGNSFTLNFIGTYQAQYYVVAQTNLAQPPANWQPVPGSTNTVSNVGGLWSITVTNPAPAYYRSKATSVCQ